MGKSKNKTTTTQQQTGTTAGTTTQTYDWKAPPINAQTQDVIDMANEPVGSDPSIAHRFAGMEEEVRRRYQDPMGAYTTPFVRQAAQLGSILKIQTERDKAMREDYHGQQGTKFNQKLAAAGLTMPSLVGTGGSTSGSYSGSSSGTQVAETSRAMTLLPAIIQGGATAAA